MIYRIECLFFQCWKKNKVCQDLKNYNMRRISFMYFYNYNLLFKMLNCDKFNKDIF